MSKDVILRYGFFTAKANARAVETPIRIPVNDPAPTTQAKKSISLSLAAARSNNDATFNNARINQFNEAISEFIDNEKIFYIDANSLFDDENGDLRADYTSDNTHIYAKYYVDWKNWMLTKAIAV